MKLVAQALRLILSALLMLSALPISATEVVCVVGPKQVAVPIATCGMPCCAHGASCRPQCQTAQKTHLPTPSCCTGKRKMSVSNRSASYSNRQSCRCETRVTSHRPPKAITLKSLARPTVEVPFDLPIRAQDVSYRSDFSESSIFGTDSGPPEQIHLDSDRSRAPPIF